MTPVRSIPIRDYERFAAETDRCPRRLLGPIYYLALGLAGEAGEVANEVKKVARDHFGVVTPACRALILYELGDVLWYLARLADYLDSSLEEVAALNVEKLTRRYHCEEKTQATTVPAGFRRPEEPPGN